MTNFDLISSYLEIQYCVFIVYNIKSTSGVKKKIPSNTMLPVNLSDIYIK